MKYTTKIFNFKKQEVTTNSIIVYVALVIMLILMLGLNLDIVPNNSDSTVIIIICMVTFLIVKFYAFFSREEHTKKLIGDLEIGIDCLNWNGCELKWIDIEDISITYLDYKGAFVNMGSGSYENKRSNGLDNEMKIKMKDSTEYEGNFLIESKKHMNDLKELLWLVVKENKISIDNAKKMIKPSNYKEHQELKKICS